MAVTLGRHSRAPAPPPRPSMVNREHKRARGRGRGSEGVREGGRERGEGGKKEEKKEKRKKKEEKGKKGNPPIVLGGVSRLIFASVPITHKNRKRRVGYGGRMRCQRLRHTPKTPVGPPKPPTGPHTATRHLGACLFVPVQN